MSNDLLRDIARSKWRYRAIEATHAHQTQLGCILLAVLGKQTGRVPRLGRTCTITSDGFVMSDFVDKFGDTHRGALVCRVDDLTRNFRGLADHLKLKDGERKEMFAELVKWIEHDYRAKREYDL